MAYRLEFEAAAQADLARLDPGIARRLLTKLRWYAAHTDEVPPEALTGSFRGLYRFRVGAYRVVYQLDRDNQRIVVRAIGHRRDIYR